MRFQSVMLKIWQYNRNTDSKGKKGFQAKKMDNQSKLQLSLLEMEQHNLFLIAIAYKFMQLKNLINKENTAGGCMT